MQPPQSNVVVVQVPAGPDFDETHRCYFCCCRCCHIRTACMVLLILELIQVAYTLYNVNKALTLNAAFLDSTGNKAIQGLSIANCICLIVTIILCFVAIFAIKPVLVWPHIGALVLSLVISLVNGIIVVAAVASPNNSWFTGQTVHGDYDPTVDHDVVTVSFAVVLIVGYLIGVAFGAYFIYLFLKLKRYLDDVESGRGQAAAPVVFAPPTGATAPPPAYKY